MSCLKPEIHVSGGPISSMSMKSTSPTETKLPDSAPVSPCATTTCHEEILIPGPHDVLLGRGGGTNNHDGNVKFRKLVNEHKLRYAACPKIEKPSIAREVVALWRKMQPPGRFLAKKEETMENRKGKNVATKRSKQEDEQPVWVEVGDKKAQEKASQCLRERTPEVLPFIRQMRVQQDQMTKQGMSTIEKQLKMQHPVQDLQSRQEIPANCSPVRSSSSSSPSPPQSGGRATAQLTPAAATNAAALYHGCATSNAHSAALPTLHSRRNSMPCHSARLMSYESRRGSMPAIMHGSSSHHAATSSSAYMTHLHASTPNLHGMTIPAPNELAMMQLVHTGNRLHFSSNTVQQLQMEAAALEAAGYHQIQDRVSHYSPDYSASRLQVMQIHHQQPLHQVEALHTHHQMFMSRHYDQQATWNLEPVSRRVAPPIDARGHRRHVNRTTGASGTEPSPLQPLSNSPQAVAVTPEGDSDQQYLRLNLESPKVYPPSNQSERKLREQTSSEAGPLPLINADLHPVGDDQREITLEEYRRTLEAYIVDNNITAPPLEISYTSDLDEEEPSCSSLHEWLDDHAAPQQRESRHDNARPDPPAARRRADPDSRKVDRHYSGFSTMSAQTLHSNNTTSLTGLSMLSDMEMERGWERQKKKRPSFSSNCSLMSELSDISHTVDELDLDDE